ncbi:hypothetical protein FF1_013123 [Malus domestica]
MDIAASASAGGGGGPGGAADVHPSREKYDVFNTMAAWLVDVNTIKILPFNLHTNGPNDVRIRIKAVGIYGSDVHYLKTMKCADLEVKEPMVIGHECARIVDKVGSEVKHLVPSDRVAFEPGIISCAHCHQCKGGRRLDNHDNHGNQGLAGGVGAVKVDG